MKLESCAGRKNYIINEIFHNCHSEETTKFTIINISIYYEQFLSKKIYIFSKPFLGDIL